MLIKPLNRWIKTTFNEIPLRTVLIVPFVLQILGTVGIVGYLSYRSGQQAVEELTNQLMTEIGDRITQNLDDYLHTSIDLTQINGKLISLGLLDWQNKSQLEAYFVEQINTFSQISSVYIATEQKDFFVVAKPQPDSLVIREWNPRTRNLENYVADLQGNRLYLRDTVPNYDPHNDPPSQPWYPIAKAAKNGTWRTVTSGVKKEELILVLVRSLPFYDSQGNFKGVVGATIFLDKMGEFLGQLKIGKTGQAFIMDNEGFLIATSTNELPFEQTAFSPKLETSNPQQWRLSVEDSRNPETQTVGKYVRSKLDNLNSINYNAVKLRIKEKNKRYCIRVIPYSLDEDSNWFIVVTVPKSDFMETIHSNVQRIVLLCIFALFVENIIAILTAKIIAKPIKKLNLAAQEIAQNNFDHPLQKTSIQEVNQLTNSFSQMAEQLTASFQALKLSEQRFSILLDSVPIGVSVFDRTGQHIFINKVGQKILGQGVKKIPSEQLSEVYKVYIAGKNRLYPPEELPGLLALKGEKVHVENMEIKVKSRRIPLEITSIPVFDESGTVIYAINMFQDITERRQIEQLQNNYQQQLEQEIAERTLNLQKSEERLNLVIAAMGEGVWDWDLINNTAWWSPRYYELVGLSVAEIEDDPFPKFYNLLHPDDRDRFQQLLNNHLENNHPYIIELRVQRPDGRYRWFLAKGQALRDENGQPYRMVGSFADISERKQAEDFLSQSEARYLSILEYQTELVARFQPDGTLSFVNEAFCRYYGVSKEELIGHSYKPKIYPEDQPLIDRCLAQLSPQQPVGTVEHRVIVNGVVRWMQWTNQAIYDSEGNLVELQSVGRDIDALKRAEELLHQSEARYLSILEYQTEFITRFQADGTLSYVNEAYCRYFGISKEDFIGHHYQPIIYPEDQAIIDRCLAQLSPQQPVFSIENRVIVNGEMRWTQWTNQAIYDTEGNLVELQSVGRDINDRKQAEIALQKTTQQLQAFLDNAPALISLFDAEGHYLQVNRGFAQLLNLSEKQIVGRTFVDFVPEDVVQLFSTRIKQLIEQGKPLIVEDELVMNGELKTFESILFPVLDENSKPRTFWSIATDISKRKQAELELQKAKEAAETASQAKGAFIANMSHELRSPLNAILGFARILKNDSQLSSEQRNNIDIIYRSGEHLLNLINQVLDLVKIEANRITLEPKDFYLDRLLEDIYNMFCLKTESKGLQLNIQKESDVPSYICTDEIKLRQVLINLLSNALKFTHRGSITLRVFVASASSEHNIILNFEVEDTGVGIAPAEQTRLFEAFMQTEAGRKIQEGTGLGLSISREFVKLMGGNISVESQLNVGSIFRFNIAAQIVDAVPPTSPVSQERITGLAPGQPLYRLLVVDDSFPNRRLLDQLLTPLGFVVQEAENGEEAISLWQQWQPHLIWMDLRMPVLDGLEATKQIRHIEESQNILNPVQIIAVSANRLPGEPQTLGFNDFIHKPFEELEIFTALQQHLGVEYSYAKNVLEEGEKSVNTANWVEEVAKLPEKVLRELEEALILGDPQLIQQMIQSLEKYNSNLVVALTPLADRFEYSRMLDLTRSVR